MIERLSLLTQIKELQIKSVLLLLEERATVPFIARYRKEKTGGLDEVQIFKIKDLWEKELEILKRQEFILETIAEQGKLDESLSQKIKNTFDLHLLEDIYLPYKKKRLTKASKAKEKGLEPLADMIWGQKTNQIHKHAQSFLREDVTDIEDALQGARDIIAERINEHEKARLIVRDHFQKKAIITAQVVKDKIKDKNAANYKDYFEFEKPLNRVQPHQLLALLRAEQEGFLHVRIAPEEEPVLQQLDSYFIKPYATDDCHDQMMDAISDAYKRLIRPSISTETLQSHKEKADLYSIEIFSENVRQLLLAAPLGTKRILALDPGFATGCKLVCLSANGDLLYKDVIYPHPPQMKSAEAKEKLIQLVHQFQIEAIAIGNGTAGRETELWARSINFSTVSPLIFLVNESGASIYSASDIARKEFPNEDITVRGAVSIGRRLADPLAELVKIDPKSIGVGQYQHDVDQKKLHQKLDAVVVSCVNAVGVNLNTASESLLAYVSGLSPSLAQQIIQFRKNKGNFKSRKELLQVPRLGEKAFEQAAGFLRIDGGIYPLDNTAVHPEAYQIVEKMALDLNCSVAALIQSSELRKSIQLSKYVTKEMGIPTLEDIMKELEKPGRDPRAEIQTFEFAPLTSIESLKTGIKIPGIITNITAFGAFMDIGIKENGLLHKSKMSHKFIQDPAQFFKLGQKLEVTVVEIDLERKRIQLSLID